MPEEDSSVERLQKKLNARGVGPKLRERRALHEERVSDEVAHDWMQQEDLQRAQEPTTYDPEGELAALRQGVVEPQGDQQVPAVLKDARVTAPAMARRSKRRMMARVVRSIFFASLAFFVIAAGAAAYFFLLGNNQVTCNKIRIDVSGPMSIASGKELVLNIGISNDNPVALEQAALIVDYPQGTRSPDSATVPLPTTREEIGTIDAGERVRTTSRSVLFGREQENKDIELTLEYTISDSNAEFTCAVTNTVLIATAPVSLSIDGLEEVSSDQELVLTATVTSNSEEVVPDQRLVARYPFGFQFIRSEPEPSHSNNVWDIGDVGQGAQTQVVIYGVVRSATTEARAVTFTLGEKDAGNNEEVLAVMQQLDHPLLIARPFLSLDLSLNGSVDSTVSVTPGESVRGVLRWKNTLTEPVYDVEIEARLPGQFIDRRTVSVDDGYFRSVDNTMLWTPQTEKDLREILPGEQGTLQFSFDSGSVTSVTGLREPGFDLAFTVRARRSADTVALQETLTSQAKRTIQFVTDLLFTPSVAYSYGPFTNTGPHPPRVDQRTTYTVLLPISNTTNALKDVSVVAELPLQVEWLGLVDPVDADVTYNSIARSVTWTLGNVPAGTRARTVAFQVAYTPSITEVNRAGSVLQGVQASGVDAFTGDVIQRVAGTLSTKLKSDPYFPGDDGIITN